MQYNRKILFLNIGWMKNYKGISGDTISGGGSFVDKKGYGHEIFNFFPENGLMHGYVQPVIPHRTIKLERVGASAKDSYLDNVLVIWVSKAPKGGVYIIGWYKNATIFREKQTPDTKTQRQHNGKILGYYAKAKEEDCVLLPPDKRTKEITRGKGGMGQSNVWYADKKEHKEFRTDVIKYIEDGNIEPGRKPTKSPKQKDILKRQKVEKAAILKTKDYYTKLGYEVFSVEKDNVGWDLEATSGKIKLLIEVKGLSQKQIVIELTPNEYHNMNKEKDIYRISVLTNALSKSSTLSIFSYSTENDGWEDDKGNILNIIEKTSARMEVSKK